ncbi:MAG: hypothetical protein ACTHNL_05020 [Devosia sp.]
MTNTLLLRLLAWLLLLGLVIVTAGPIGWRPVTPLPAQVERAVALMVVGFVFALAYPRQIWLVALLVFGTTILLEVLQVFEPSRHGRLVDAAVKLIGGAVGLLAGGFINRYGPRR